MPDADGAGDRQLKNIPRHLFRPDVSITLPRNTTVHARYTRTAGAYADDENLVPLGGRSTIDVRVAKRFSRMTARLDLLNLTDDRYEEAGFVLADFQGGFVPFYYPAPGFTVRAGLEFTF
jgi:outer membrane receptor protein involved in Fe transport